MKTKEIPRDEWAKFFDNVSQRQQGWRCTLEVFGPEIGDQIEERDMFLVGITAETSNGRDHIEIMLGGKPEGHVTHIVAAPIQVELQQTDLGVDSAIAIKSADRNTCLLHLN